MSAARAPRRRWILPFPASDPEPAYSADWQAVLFGHPVRVTLDFVPIRAGAEPLPFAPDMSFRLAIVDDSARGRKPTSPRPGA